MRSGNAWSWDEPTAALGTARGGVTASRSRAVRRVGQHHSLCNPTDWRKLPGFRRPRRTVLRSGRVCGPGREKTACDTTKLAKLIAGTRLNRTGQTTPDTARHPVGGSSSG